MNYTVKAAARATGISESRLRTWERRYGIPHPDRAPSGRRLYDDEDLALIRRMATLVDAGMSAAQAAEAARSGLPGQPERARAEHTLVALIADAAERFDERALSGALRQAVSELGWARALGEVIFPSLKRVGIYWETAVFPPANEHFASELVRREVLSAINALPEPSADAPRVLLACPEDERHDLGVAALSLLLRQAGIRTLYLGADVPTADLLEAYDATKPDAICLSATGNVGLASLIRASMTIVAARRVRLFIGGPAMAADGSEAAGIHLPFEIGDAAQALATTLTTSKV